MNGAFTVAPATTADRLDLLRVLDAAMVETDAARVSDRIDAGDAFVARFDRTDAVVGGLVAIRPPVEDESGETLHIDAVAVRRARRGRGIGSALVDRAVDRARTDPQATRVTAAFDESLVGFYADLGFDITPAGEVGEGSEDVGNGERVEGDRMRGVRSVENGTEAEQ